MASSPDWDHLSLTDREQLAGLLERLRSEGISLSPPTILNVFERRTYTVTCGDTTWWDSDGRLIELTRDEEGRVRLDELGDDGPGGDVISLPWGTERLGPREDDT